MIRAMHLNKDNQMRSDLQPMDIAFALHDEGGLVWVDLEAAPDEEAEPLLTGTFGFHPLAVRNALRESRLPKIDDWGKYLYIVIHTVAMDPNDSSRVETRELDVFLGKNFIITYHPMPIRSVQSTWERLQRDARPMREGVDHILYWIGEEIATSFWQVAEQIDQSVDQVEAAVLTEPKRSILENIFSLKRAAVQLRRVIAPQQEVFSRLAREEFAVIDEKDRVYFRDIYDHMARLYDQVDGVRELVTSAMDTHLSMSNNRLGDVMRTLTVITTTFMPLTFVTSFFGMNFFFPEAPITFMMELPMLIIAMVLLMVIPVAMFLWMRRRGWVMR